jgi:hypothetical protein
MKAAVGILLALTALYHLNGRAHPEADCIPAPYTAWALVRHGSLDLSGYAAVAPYRGGGLRQRPDGAWVSRYPPGSALAAVPFTAPFAAFREEPLSEGQMIALGKLAAAVYVAAAAALFFLICRELAPSAAWSATVLFALGTCLYSVASQALWMHGPATFWMCCALYLLLRPGGGTAAGTWAAGLALGLAVLTRPSTALVALATGIALLLRRRWGQAAWLALGGIGPVALLCLFNASQLGHPLLGGYADDYRNAIPPWWLGLSGLLAAPSRGVLVYSPALLLVPAGVAALWRRGAEDGGWRRDLLLAWLAAACVTVVQYACYFEWRGGWCYGPRYLCEMMPALCLLVALGYERLRAGWRPAAVALVGLSVAVHVVGVFGYGGYQAWQRRHELADQGRCLFALTDTQIEAHARALLRKWAGQAPDGP